jgi:hypothetical protein
MILFLFLLLDRTKVSCLVFASQYQFRCSHYRKNGSCRAAQLCRAPLHGKDGFAVRPDNNARQRKRARQTRLRTHGKETPTTKRNSNAQQRQAAWQRAKLAHGKESCHGKGARLCRARVLCRGPCYPARQRSLCRAQNNFFFFFHFYFILFNTYVYFSISFIFC